MRKLAFVVLVFPFAGPIRGQDLSPREAVQKMKVPDGFEAKLVASEPMVRQTIALSFDDRGRMWALQYLQYPRPAGLKVVKHDEFLRTVYDRVPEPPPKGPKGADRITILEDTDGDGVADKARDFLSDLNLCTGFAIGHGGVFVAQSPYLLFYPDRNGDDVPDGDPEVLLSGFGMEDTHALPNSLQWGPDGRLYGNQGSNVTANIRGVEFQQAIWRYHPITKEFEVFSEGGGNTWGLDFDRHGNAITGTNFSDCSMLHQVQGGYYVKRFGKHGPLRNPYTFGYFEHVPYTGFKGGHVTAGGIIYQGGAFPPEWDGKYIGGKVLSNNLHWDVLEPKGSTFTARFGGDFLVSNDPWFRPIDCQAGPDGSVYIADWHDKRANHVDPRDTWDKTNGRIYKIEHKGTPKVPPFSLSKLSSAQLVDLLSHKNDWFRREARRILAERRDPAVLPTLRKLIAERKDELALQALWALYVSGGFDDDLAAALLVHENEDVRGWTVRFIGDAKKVSPALYELLLKMARTEPSPAVRSQLASSGLRFPAKDAMPIVAELLKRNEDVDDLYIPLLLWWAIEDKAISEREHVLWLLEKPEAWKVPIAQRYILERLARRYLVEGTEMGQSVCARLLATAPGPAEVDALVRGMDKALEGRRLDKVPTALEKPMADLWKARGSDVSVIRLALRLGSVEAFDRALKEAADENLKEKDRIALIEGLGQAGRAECVPVLVKILVAAASDDLRAAILAALQPFAGDAAVAAVVAEYPRFNPALRGRARSYLCSRLGSARELVKAVEAGKIDSKEVSLDQIRLILAYGDEELNKIVEKRWGKIAAQTEEEKRVLIQNFVIAMRRGKGDPAKGKILFQKICGVCHTLFGEGNKIGPELTGADRKNLEFLVQETVDPGGRIRPEYMAYTILTKDGQVLNGLLAEQTPQSVTILDAQNVRTVIPRDKIQAIKASEKSLMPERLLDPLDDQQIRDFFNYLMKESP